MDSKYSEALAQVVGAALAVVAALVVAGADAWNNWHYLAQINITLAIMAVVAAFSLVFMPWGKAKIASVALVVVIGATVIANDLGVNISATADVSAIQTNAAADASAARATLARITEVREVAALEMLVADAEKTFKSEDAKARALLGSDTACSNRRDCRDARTTKAALVEALANARARDAAKAELVNAASKADKAGPAKIDVIAASVAPYLGIEATAFMRRWALAIVILAVTAAQLIALYGHTALSRIGEGLKVMREIAAAKAEAEAVARAKAEKSEKKALAIVDVCPNPATSPQHSSTIPATPPRRGRKGKLTADEALEILRGIARNSDGRIVGSNATLAALLGVHPNTLCDRKGWLARWEKQGFVRIESRKRGQKVVAIPATKAA